MALLFSPPKAPALPPPPQAYAPSPPAPPPPTRRPAPAAGREPATEAGPAPRPSVEDPDPDTPLPEDTEEARQELVKRRSRGRTGTVRTSWRGLFEPRSPQIRRKSLLGE